MDYKERDNQVTETLCFSQELHGMMDTIAAAGDGLPLMLSRYRTPAFLIRGCTSTSWFHCLVDDTGKVRIEGDSNSVILKGIMYYFWYVLDGERATDIDMIHVTWHVATGLLDLLTPQRQGAVFQMIKRIEDAVRRNDKA